MEFPELSYANENQRPFQRWLIRQLETLSGRDYFVDLYKTWRSEVVGASEYVMTEMLALVDLRLHVRGTAWPPQNLPDTPVVLIANHPYGIGDGIAILSLAEKLGRPFRVIINNDLLKVPEMRALSLPISFDETREALQMNLETRREAVRLLKEGVTMVVFPAGGVATAPRGFGKAQDLPWKQFPAKLVQSAGASVIPVFFEGQCSRLFHLSSLVSMTLRTSLLIREFRRLCGKDIIAHVGPVIEAQTLAAIRDRKALTGFLYQAVFGLEPEEHRRKRRRIA
ncbi:MAG: lysophospholipid acyltransferase family protein [Nitratireductor sp.]|nr:lysophospholipid acyltransferase family protein [Nitratireductor sp.]